MKKFFVLFVCTILYFNFLLPLQKGYATTLSYTRILEEEVGFYKSTLDSNPLFYLPYSYYAKIIEEGEFFTRIECYGENSNTTMLEGYILTSKVNKEDALEVFSPYLDYSLTTSTVAPFYTDLSFENIHMYLFEGRTLNYYGYNKKEGNYVYFVEYNGKLGFVKEEHLTPFSIPLHQTPIDLPTTTPDPPTEEQPNTTINDVNVFKIVILSLVSLLVVAVAVYIFIPKKKQVNVGYYDENDFE